MAFKIILNLKHTLLLFRFFLLLNKNLNVRTGKQCRIVLKITNNKENGKSAHSFEVFPLKKVTYNKWSQSMISNRIWYELQLLTLPTASPFVPIWSPPFQSECHNDLEGNEIMILLIFFSISSPSLIMSCNIILILDYSTALVLLLELIYKNKKKVIIMWALARVVVLLISLRFSAVSQTCF